MGYYNMLDEMIQSKCLDKEGVLIESSYIQFRDEVGMHMNGELTFEQLSPLAQDLISEWEGLMEEEGHKAEMYYR